MLGGAAGERSGVLRSRCVAEQQAGGVMVGGDVPLVQREPTLLLERQIEALFVLDARQRLLRVHEPGGGAAPLVFLGRTAAGNRWRLNAHLPEEIASAAEALLAAERVRADVGPETPPQCATDLRRLLGVEGDAGRIFVGPAWLVPQQSLDALPADVLLLADDARARAVLQPHFAWLALEVAERLPIAVVLRDGEAVAVCCCARRTAAVAEAGLDTLAAWRGRGFAVAVVRAWAAAVQRSGRLALYSTDWDNLASQGVARRLHLLRYAEDWSLSAAASTREA